MSLVIDPIISVRPGDTKITTVSVSIAAGSISGSAAVPGLTVAKRILAAWLTGAGGTFNFALSSPFVGTGANANTVGVSLTIGTIAGVSAIVLVQGV